MSATTLGVIPVPAPVVPNIQITISGPGLSGVSVTPGQFSTVMDIVAPLNKNGFDILITNFLILSK